MPKVTITIKFSKEIIEAIEDLGNEAAAALLRAHGLDDSEYRKPANSEGLMELDEIYKEKLNEIVKNVVK